MGRGPNINWPSDEKLIELISSGKEIKDLATKIGTTEKAVRKRLTERGIKVKDCRRVKRKYVPPRPNLKPALSKAKKEAIEKGEPVIISEEGAQIIVNHPADVNRPQETPEEFLARGGKITYLGNNYDNITSKRVLVNGMYE